MSRISLCGLTLEEINALTAGMGASSDHSLKIANIIYKKRPGSISDITGIPKKLIQDLDSLAKTGFFPPISSETSEDGTVKYLFSGCDGKKYETVYIPDKDRHTVCVSSQSGCRMGCPFCVTGRYGFHGNLSAGDILNQVLSIPQATKVTHVVFMGMGEPMDNYESVIKSTRILTAEWGKSLSIRNITVSTVGITPGIKKFLNESECNLTVSLFSPFHEERKKVVPVENRYPVKEIITILKNSNVHRRRRLTFSYVMIKDLNDTDIHLSGLRSMLSGSGIRLNLLPYHPVHDDNNVPSSAERMQHFKHNLVLSGISASIRKSRGSDISAACGLLASGLVS